jgi:hypothetical protein
MFAMKSRIVLSALLVVLSLLAGCGDDPVPPTSSSSAAVVVRDAGHDAAADNGIGTSPSLDGIGTSPSADDDPGH